MYIYIQTHPYVYAHIAVCLLLVVYWDRTQYSTVGSTQYRTYWPGSHWLGSHWPGPHWPGSHSVPTRPGSGSGPTCPGPGPTRPGSRPGSGSHPAQVRVPPGRVPGPVRGPRIRLGPEIRLGPRIRLGRLLIYPIGINWIN